MSEAVRSGPSRFTGAVRWVVMGVLVAACTPPLVVTDAGADVDAGADAGQGLVDSGSLDSGLDDAGAKAQRIYQSNCQ